MDALLRNPAPSRTFDDQSDDSIAVAAVPEPDAFTALYRANVLDVYRYCYRRLRNREAAEDATSQIFINAYTGLERLGNKPFRPWLFAIAHNVVVDVHRSRRPVFPLDEATDHEDSDPTP